tara:strand:+ start:1502 stop:2830 length:1329 start_codon:yes stop_codon:yes gene_type:complete
LRLQEKLLQSFKARVESLNGSEPFFMNEMRTNAFDVFKNQGFPTTKDEEWKYTSLKKIVSQEFKDFTNEPRLTSSEEIKAFLCPDVPSYKLIFVNGRFNSNLSSSASCEDFFIGSMKEGMKAMPDLFASNYGGLASRDQSFVSLNTALANQGAFVYVKKGVKLSKLVQVLFVNTNDEHPRMLNSRNLFLLEDRAEVQILERHQSLDQGHVFSNVVTESYVGNKAFLKHFKIQNDLESSSIIDSTFVKQGEKSFALVDTFAFGGELIRNNLHFVFAGENAQANMDAITLLKGKTHVDHHTFVDHALPNCQSNQLYKGIYDERSKGVFNGKVMVRKDAQKTNAFQQNNNLLLSDFASIDTKPQLEIFADDVACSHGCTIGQLDKEALFYMQSRGIPLKEAKAFLMFAFAGDTLKNVSISPLKYLLIDFLAHALKVDLKLNDLEV